MHCIITKTGPTIFNNTYLIWSGYHFKPKNQVQDIMNIIEIKDYRKQISDERGIYIKWNNVCFLCC